MLKKLFLSIIILSALASEGGAYFSADLLDYYLVNFVRLDIMQANQLGNQQTENTPKRIGTPAAFYKVISQNAIDVKSAIKHSYTDFTATVPIVLGLVLIFALYKSFNIMKSAYARRSFLNLTDSSPPVFCLI